MNQIINRDVFLRKLGLIDYKQGWDYQTQLFDAIVNTKIANRDKLPEQQQPTPNYLLSCEHPHVFTLGKSGNKANLLIAENILKEQHATYYEINRGGDITYHGPGQIVVYPVIDMENFFTDIHQYMRLLEEAVILTLKEYKVEAGRIEGLTGVWIDIEKPALARKIAAMGVKTSRWVTMHGLALNINTDLTYFDSIVPCGISDKKVTSLSKETGLPINMVEAENKLLHHLTDLFGMNIIKEKE